LAIGPIPLSRGLKTALTALLFVPFLTSGNDRPDQLEQVLQRGSLTMLTRNGASTYYIGPDGPTAPEVELVRAFTEYLGVDLDIQVATAFGQLSGMLDRREGDLIAANLTRTPARELVFNFGPDYIETHTLVVCRRKGARPKSLSDLEGRKIMIIAGSSYEELLEDAAKDYPNLRWEARDDVGMEQLLLSVADGAIDATLVDENIFALSSHFFPRIEAAFTLPGNLPQAWAFPPGSDDSLVQQARTFMRQLDHSGRLEKLHAAFFTPLESMDRVGMSEFMLQVRERLPSLIPIFREVADANGIDWRLLAAIGYQESHWDPEASSVTGVRGIMMLTQNTARQMGLTDRLDPRQSIDGGARYFLRLHGRLPARIPEPDRSWMALAAYNMGLGHLEDARVLTQNDGGNPDSWQEVEAHLDLLSQESWHSQTRYGYARGHEARQFVQNIQSYYETLVWMDTREHPSLVADL